MNLGKNLLRFNYEQEYILIDFESTGLNLFHSKPWQVSYVHFTLNRIIEQYDAFIWVPDLQMSAEAARVTRFNYENYKSKAQEAETVREKIDNLIYNPKIRVVWHNGIRFDFAMHSVLRRICGKRPDYSYLERSIDTAVLSKMYHTKIKADNNNWLSQQFQVSDMRMGKDEEGKIIRTTLKAMALHYGISVDENKLHDSLYDCGINVDVFKKLLNTVEI